MFTGFSTARPGTPLASPEEKSLRLSLHLCLGSSSSLFLPEYRQDGLSSCLQSGALWGSQVLWSRDVTDRHPRSWLPPFHCLPLPFQKEAGSRMGPEVEYFPNVSAVWHITAKCDHLGARSECQCAVTVTNSRLTGGPQPSPLGNQRAGREAGLPPGSAGGDLGLGGDPLRASGVLMLTWPAPRCSVEISSSSSPLGFGGA